MRVVSRISSIAANELANVYRLVSRTEYNSLRAFPEDRGIVFSFYARTVSGEISLRVRIQSPFSSQTKDFLVTEKWLRFEVSMINDITLQPLNVFFKNLNATTDVAIAFPQLEKGLRATSPIPPDIQLPSIAKKSSLTGSSRSAEEAHTNNLVVDSNSGTLILVAEPLAKTDQIMDDEFRSFISLWASQEDLEVSIGISGFHSKQFVIRHKIKNKDTFIISDIIGGNKEYFISIVFDRNNLNLIINGSIAATLLLNNRYIFDRTYIGSSRNPNEQLGGYLKRLLHYEAPLLYPRLLEIYGLICPHNSQYTYQFMLKYFKYSLASESEVYTLNNCLDQEGFSYLISQLKFAIPEIFLQFPPGRYFQEEDIRDWVMAIMKRPSRHGLIRESYSKIGRTDLILSYCNTKENPEEDTLYNNYRIEFKIWGRDGYKEAPSQPLKYMEEDELVGVFIMVDRRQNPKIEDFENIIINNLDYPCFSIREIPIIETEIRYFISFHTDIRYRSLRMMINIFLPIQGD